MKLNLVLRQLTKVRLDVNATYTNGDGTIKSLFPTLMER